MLRRRWPWLLALLGAACPHPAPTNGHETETAARQAERQLALASTRPAPALRPVEAELIAHGPRTERRVALTFDACTTRNVSQYDARITRELVDAGAPATLFLGGGWAREEAAHVRELATNPLFELGNHSYTHPHMTGIADAGRVEEELVRTQSEIFELTGQTPRLFRPPYGEYDDRLVRTAARVGLTTVEYDLPSGDPDQHATRERLEQWVLRQARPGSIIVMHVNHLRFHTAEALPGIIRGLRDAGYQLVTVGELLREEHALDRDGGG
jgi:peptidoglycan/xylan/chitin deacetylase (PgdA/CDA1 family)